MDDFQKGYNQALEDITKRLKIYYGHIDNTNGASVQFFVEQIRREYAEQEQLVGKRY